MSFPLPRLPLLAISEVIKSMDTREILCLSVLSKKSANFVMLSLPKNSLSAEFTFQRDRFEFELMPKGFIKQRTNFLPVARCGNENESVFTRFSTCGLYCQYEWTGTFEIEESTRRLFYYFSKIFKKSKLSITFQYQTREEFAMEMMRFAWQNGFLLDRINFYSTISSSESIQKLLNRCNGHHTSLDIKLKLPKEFKCTPPPGGYKFKSFSADYSNWVNPDDFLQCRELFLTSFPDVTMEYLNGLLKKIVNLECRTEQFCFGMESMKPRDFAQIVRGLSDSKTQRDGEQEWLQFERKDGRKLLISLYRGHYLKMNIV